MNNAFKTREKLTFATRSRITPHNPPPALQGWSSSHNSSSLNLFVTLLLLIVSIMRIFWFFCWGACCWFCLLSAILVGPHAHRLILFKHILPQTIPCSLFELSDDQDKCENQPKIKPKRLCTFFSSPHSSHSRLSNSHPSPHIPSYIINHLITNFIPSPFIRYSSTRI